MSLGILGNKIGMTQIFDESGNIVPVTVIKVGPCVVTQIKTVLTDGYNAIQIGYFPIPRRKINRPELGHLNKTNTIALKFLKEFKTCDDYVLGQLLNVEQFKEGQLVDVTAKSKGKGFAGNQKRNNFTRGPMTHGSKNHRQPGSIGQGSTPGRVYPGKKMPGRLGGSSVTISCLKIIKIDLKNNIIVLSGSIPGKPGNLITIKPTKRV